MSLTLRIQHEFSLQKQGFRMGGQQRSRFLRPTHALKKTRVSLTGVRNDISHWDTAWCP